MIVVLIVMGCKRLCYWIFVGENMIFRGSRGISVLVKENKGEG